LMAAAAMGRGGDPESSEPSELKNIADQIRAGHEKLIDDAPRNSEARQ
jgi:hypothetical protein